MYVDVVGVSGIGFVVVGDVTLPLFSVFFLKIKKCLFFYKNIKRYKHKHINR